MINTKTISLKTKGETDIVDITDKVISALGKQKLKNGVMAIFVPGATGGITTVEFESGALVDLKGAYEKLAPRDADYAHNKAWHDGNGFSHVRASMTGPGLSVPIVDGKLTLGTWQRIVFIDFDNRPRSRKLILQFLGE